MAPIYEPRETEQEIELIPCSLKDKLIWTFRIWFGFKGKIKFKIRVSEYNEQDML